MNFIQIFISVIPSYLYVDSNVSHHGNISVQKLPQICTSYCKNGGNLVLVLNNKKWKFLHKIICCGDLVESPRGHMSLWRTNDNYAKKSLRIGSTVKVSWVWRCSRNVIISLE